MCASTHTHTQGDGEPGREKQSETHTETNKKGETASMASKWEKKKKSIFTTNQRTQTQNTKETHMHIGPIDQKTRNATLPFCVCVYLMVIECEIYGALLLSFCLLLFFCLAWSFSCLCFSF